MTAPLLLFLALQLADIATTAAIIHRGGRELNPIVRRVMASCGTVPGLLLVKIAIIGPVGWLAWALLSPGQFTVALWLACGVYVAVLVNNLRALR